MTQNLTEEEKMLLQKIKIAIAQKVLDMGDELLIDIINNTKTPKEADDESI